MDKFHAKFTSIMESGLCLPKVFTEEHKKGIKLILGLPYNPHGRHKIERYNKTFYQELIALMEFHSFSHFKCELRNFEKQYNYLRKQEILGWITPSSIYQDKIIFTKTENISKADRISVDKTDNNCGTLNFGIILKRRRMRYHLRNTYRLHSIS
jgi:transposase InsO family protein